VRRERGGILDSINIYVGVLITRPRFVTLQGLKNKLITTGHMNAVSSFPVTKSITGGNKVAFFGLY
jgi:hypothetical protein